MPDNLLSRLGRISSHVLPGTTRIEVLGENYYTFEMIDTQGTRCVLPRIWIDPEAGDRQIGDKLTRMFKEALHPECDPDDASVPTLQTEGRRS